MIEGFRVQGLGFRVYAIWLRVSGLEYRVSGVGYGDTHIWFVVAFRIQGCGNGNTGALIIRIGFGV